VSECKVDDNEVKSTTATSEKVFQDSGFLQGWSERMRTKRRPGEKSAGMEFFVNNKKRNGVQGF